MPLRAARRGAGLSRPHRALPPTQSRYVVIWQASTVTLQRHASASSVFRPMNATLAMLAASARSGAASGGLPSSKRSGPASPPGWRRGLIGRLEGLIGRTRGPIGKVAFSAFAPMGASS